MGADSDDPEGFLNWLRLNKPRWQQLHPDFADLEIEAKDFAPRIIYAEYLRSLLEQAEQRLATKNIRLQRLLAWVTGVEALEHSDKLQVKTNLNVQLIVDSLVFCTGNSTPNHLDIESSHAMSPYSSRFLREDWHRIKDIAILGSGLCMVDAIHYLLAHGYEGNIHVFSRQGLVPLPHAEREGKKAPRFDISGLTRATAIIKAVRSRIMINEAEGIPWQETLNSLRYEINRLWLSLTDAERQKLRRVIPFWNVARHRIAAPIHQQLIKLRNSGKLTLIKGTIQKAESDGEYVLAHMKTKIIFIQAQKLILCSGYACSYPQLQLLCSNLLDIPQLQTKLNCSKPDFKISGSHDIYALGPALTGVLFETTAIHEIRQQSVAISSALSQQLYLQHIQT
jgi:uncharacterized NAD(P)/FAD-binding protein YdhS